MRFGIVDLSLAPTPAVGDSVAEILEAMGLERTGAPGTTAALALLTDAVKKGGAMASSSSSAACRAPSSRSPRTTAWSPRCEAGALSLEKLEAMTAVCSVGLDMVAVPGDTAAETLAAIIADEIAIGVFNNKTTAVRIIPVPGKGVGEKVVYGGLLGEAPIMPVSPLPLRRLHPPGRPHPGARSSRCETDPSRGTSPRGRAVGALGRRRALRRKPAQRGR